MEHTDHSKPYVVALEGGPCAGKTTTLDRLVVEANMAEVDLTVLPEVASGYIQETGVDIPWLAQHDRVELLDVETEILELIVSGIQKATQEKSGMDAIIVADRCDVAAYLQPNEYQQIIHRLGYTAAPHMSLVDKIAYMPSLAHHDPALYEKLVGTNSARYEDAVAARATCDANRQTLDMHPGFEVFDDHDFDTRLRKITHAILGSELSAI